MYRKIAVIAVAVLALGGTLWAADEAQTPVEKQALIQARVNTRIREIQKLLNDYNALAAYGEVQGGFTAATAELQKQLAAENSKAADGRDQALIDQLNAKSTKIGKAWADFQGDWAAYLKKTAEPVGVYQAMTSINQNLAQVEGWWAGNGMRLDPDTLTACVSAELKRLDEVKADLTKVITELKTACDQRLAQFKE